MKTLSSANLSNSSNEKQGQIAHSVHESKAPKRSVNISRLDCLFKKDSQLLKRSSIKMETGNPKLEVPKSKLYFLYSISHKRRRFLALAIKSHYQKLTRQCHRGLKRRTGKEFLHCFYKIFNALQKDVWKSVRCCFSSLNFFQKPQTNNFKVKELSK